MGPIEYYFVLAPAREKYMTVDNCAIVKKGSINLKFITFRDLIKSVSDLRYDLTALSTTKESELDYVRKEISTYINNLSKDAKAEILPFADRFTTVKVYTLSQLNDMLKNFKKQEVEKSQITLTIKVTPQDLLNNPNAIIDSLLTSLPKEAFKK